MVQGEVKEAIFKIAKIVGVDPGIALAVSHIESRHGVHLKSKTGALGVFQMTSIAVRDLHHSMATPGHEIIGICAGICFLSLLMKRHEDLRKALDKYCDPNDREWYADRVIRLANEYRREIIENFC